MLSIWCAKKNKKQLPQVFEIFGGPLGHAALSCHLVKNSGPEKIRNMQIFIILQSIMGKLHITGHLKQHFVKLL